LASQQHGFDTWLEKKREAVVLHLQQIISTQLELHHAEVVAEMEKHLALPDFQLTQSGRYENGSSQGWPGKASDTGKTSNKEMDGSGCKCGVAVFPEQMDSTLRDASVETGDQQTSSSMAPASVSLPLPNGGTICTVPSERKANFLRNFSSVPVEPVTPEPNRHTKTAYKNHRLASLAAQDDEGATHVGCLTHLVGSTKFELVIVLLIFLNCICIAAEAQLDGYEVGYSLKYEGYAAATSERYNLLRRVLKVGPVIFTCIFVCELLMRIGVYKIQTWKHPYLMFDLILVVISLVDIISVGAFGGINPSAVRCIRVLNLFKMVKIFRSVSWMSSLFLIVRSILASFNALFWAFTLLLLLQTCVGMCLSQVLLTYLEDSSHSLTDRRTVFMYFGTFTRTMVTMFEISVGNWAPACRTLMEDVSEWFGLFFILYSCTLCFAVVNVIRAVFIAETGRIAAGDDEIAMMRKEQNKAALAQKLQDVFEELDDSGDGVVNQYEFDQLMTDTIMQKYLSTLDVDINDMQVLFRILDDGDGNISLDEFCKGVVMVKGQAKAIDMIRVEKSVIRIENKINHAVKHLTQKESEYKTEPSCA